MGYYKDRKVKVTKYKPKPYDTPENIGEKMQIDVKYVPSECKSPNLHDKNFYQYTMIDEATREGSYMPMMRKVPPIVSISS